MTRLAGKKHPAPAKYAPRDGGSAYGGKAPPRLSCLTLCGARCGEKAAALFFEKSKKPKRNGAAIAALI